MLPYWDTDHIMYIYARWGPGWINFPRRYILAEFKQGNFVFKWTTEQFIQVHPHHSQRLLSEAGDHEGGIEVQLLPWTYRPYSTTSGHALLLIPMECFDYVTRTHSHIVKPNQEDKNVAMMWTILILAHYSDCVCFQLLFILLVFTILPLRILPVMQSMIHFWIHVMGSCTTSWCFLVEKLAVYDGTKHVAPFNSPIHSTNAPTCATSL